MNFWIPEEKIDSFIKALEQGLRELNRSKQTTFVSGKDPAVFKRYVNISDDQKWLQSCIKRVKGYKETVSSHKKELMKLDKSFKTLRKRYFKADGKCYLCLGHCQLPGGQATRFSCHDSYKVPNDGKHDYIVNNKDVLLCDSHFRMMESSKNICGESKLVRAAHDKAARLAQSLSKKIGALFLYNKFKRSSPYSFSIKGLSADQAQKLSDVLNESGILK